MLELAFGLSRRPTLYQSLGALDQSVAPMLGHAAKAAQARDAYACGYCGFRSRKYQRCVGPLTELAEDMTTACIFCEQVLCVDLVPRLRSGVLIWLPEVSQATLNRAMPEIYALRITNRPASDRARTVLDRLFSRRDAAKTEFGSDDPEQLVRGLRAGDEQRRKIGSLTQNGLRLLALDRRLVSEGDLEFNQFPQILAYWRSKDGPLSPLNWRDCTAVENFPAIP